MKCWLSQRRARALLQVGRSNVNEDAKQEALVVEAMRTLSGPYPRFRSRRIRVIPVPEGILVVRKLLTKNNLRAGYTRHHGLSHRKCVSPPRLFRI